MEVSHQRLPLCGLKQQKPANNWCKVLSSFEYLAVTIHLREPVNPRVSQNAYIEMQASYRRLITSKTKFLLLGNFQEWINLFVFKCLILTFLNANVLVKEAAQTIHFATMHEGHQVSRLHTVSKQKRFWLTLTQRHWDNTGWHIDTLHVCILMCQDGEQRS